MNEISLTIAATSIRDVIPKEASLAERLKFAMRYTRKQEAELFWMEGQVTDNEMFKAALAAVMMAGNEEDKDIIKRSLKPLQALSALLAGVSVNLEDALEGEDLIPLLRLWHDSKV